MFFDESFATELELSRTLEDFVVESTKTFDESHNYVHMKKVVENSLNIITHDSEIQSKLSVYPEIVKLVTITAWLHDVRDHKYPDSIGQEEFENFIKDIDPINWKIICQMIQNVSWSKENKGLRKHFEEPYQTILNIVSDADRLEALGTIGISRCETYTRENGGRVPEDVIVHCHEKLLRILPEGFIKTEYGKLLAQPLHDQIVEYVSSFES